MKAITAACIGFVVASVGTLRAGVLFDQSLVSPGGATPGWYDGSGNPNGGFTVDTEGSIELGLRAKERQSPNVIDSTDNTYAVPVGAQTAGPGPASSTHAWWNYEFSIDLGPSLTFGDVNTFLTITNVELGQSITVIPTTYWSDDTGFGSSGKTAGLSSTEWGAQQSENPVFSDFPFAATYDENASATYIFTLAVDSLAGTQLASDTIVVNVGAGAPAVPEPATFALFGLGIAGAGVIRRKFKTN